MKKTFAVLVLLVMVACCFVVSCKEKSTGGPVDKEYTYNTFTAVSPSNWNELTYQDNNDTQIMNYLAGSFFSFDFKYDDAGEIIDGEFVVDYEFATALEDVTQQYGAEYGVKVGKDGAYEPGYIWKISIRDDGKWDNGDPIVAGDFVYTMQEQLNPLFKNYRADSYYKGSVNIVNAFEYVFQSSTDWYDATTPYGEYSEDLDSLLYFYMGPKVTGEGDSAKKTYTYVGNWLYKQLEDDFDAATAAKIFKGNFVSDLDLEVVATMEGKTFAEIKADPAMKAEFDKLLVWWQDGSGDPDESLHFFVAEYTLPELSFDKVGIKALDDTTILIAMTKAIEFVDANGNLTYHCPYEFGSLPLVHKATYEASKVAPATEGGLWTSKYNSSLETTRSWGPYKLTEFQAGKHYTLERNENWYGYNMKENEGLYQTDKISCETIEKYETQFLKFLQGGLDSVAISVSVAQDYKNSKQAYFTPDDYVGSLQLQSSKEALKNRETEGVNKSILSYRDFRKALSLGLNRADFVNKTTTSSLAGLGLYNSMHYIDVANGVTYRSTDYAKQALCDVYGIDVSKYASLDDAVDAISGYDLVQARAAVDSAYDAAFVAGDIKEGDKVVLTYGTSIDNENVRRSYNYLNSAWQELMVGTKLEGRFELEFDSSFGTKWANQFRDGAYDVCMGGWTGAAWDPGYFIMAYLSPEYMYSKAWNTSTHALTATVHGVNADGKVTNNADDVFTATLPIFGTDGNSWYELLNDEYAQGILLDSFRCELLAQMEAEVLKQYYTVPYANSFSATLHSYKIDYITYTYNTFMAYGGIKYMRYNYSDAEWTEYVKNAGGELNYK